MKNTIYKLTLNESNNQICLSLYQNKLRVRKWFGVFATIIFDKTTSGFLQATDSKNTFYLKKSQIHHFFTEVTYLYQQAIWHYRIEKDLFKLSFPNKCTCIAESLLLQIRMCQYHPNYDELLSNYLEAFQNRDYKIFDQTIGILLANNLIQLIETKDGRKFFDKNPTPHSHLYFKKYNKLVDCTDEIMTFFHALEQPEPLKLNSFPPSTAIYYI